jgi:hypothetical protein
VGGRAREAFLKAASDVERLSLVFVAALDLTVED